MKSDLNKITCLYLSLLGLFFLESSQTKLTLKSFNDNNLRPEVNFEKLSRLYEASSLKIWRRKTLKIISKILKRGSSVGNGTNKEKETEDLNYSLLIFFDAVICNTVRQHACSSKRWWNMNVILNKI